MIVDAIFRLILGFIGLIEPIINIFPTTNFSESLEKFNVVFDFLFGVVGYFIPLDVVFLCLAFISSLLIFKVSFAIFLRVKSFIPLISG